MENNEKQWYAVRTTKSEKQTFDRMKKIIAGGTVGGLLEVMMPLEKKYKKRGDKTVIVEKNSLPGYLLVRVENKFLQEIKIFLSQMVSVGLLPTPLKKEEIERFFKIEDDEEISLEMVEGQTVNIIEGPFSGWKGEIIEVINEKQKLKVEVKVFGRVTPVEVTFKQVSQAVFDNAK